MEIGNKNPFIMDQFAARYAVPAREKKPSEDFGAALGNAEEMTEQKKKGQAAESDRSGQEKDTDYRQFLLEKMEEMRANIRNGTIQPEIQIGAEAYTQEEWEKLLSKIDAAEEALREQLEARLAVDKEEAREDEEDCGTKIITGPDGARILLITTSFGEMSIKLSEADDSARYSALINHSELAEETADPDVVSDGRDS